MYSHPLRRVKAMVADYRTLESIEDFVENETHLSEDDRSALWLLAWIETGRQHLPASTLTTTVCHQPRIQSPSCNRC
jgi:hypothetical protein